jgi:hypothetical protein
MLDVYESAKYRGGALERYDALRYPQRMTASATPLSIYQLRIVLRGVSPLIWRQVLVHAGESAGGDYHRRQPRCHAGHAYLENAGL